MNYLDKTPFAFSGVILGLAALGNLLLSYGTVWRLICGAIALILFIPYTIKLLLDFSGYKEEMKKSLPASVAPTYPMAMMLLATYLTPLLRIPLGISEVIWWIGLIINIVMVIYFIYEFVFKRDINLVYPSWGVVFVGFVVASVTAPVFDQIVLGLANTRDEAVVIDGEIEILPMKPMTLVIDSRIVTRDKAVRISNFIKDMMEKPSFLFQMEEELAEIEEENE